jgi:hypothetical protein
MIGATIADNHKMNHKLNIFDQIILPTDKDQFQFRADIPDKNNSGADVHIAKTVNQINSDETLKYLAILTLVLIKWFAAYHSRANQIIRTIQANIILLFYIIKTVIQIKVFKI